MTLRNWSNAAVLFFSKRGRKTFLQPFPRSNFVVSDKLDVERQMKKDISRINTRVLFLKATGQMQAAKKMDRVIKIIPNVVHSFEAFCTGFWNFESSMELSKLYPEFEKDAYSELIMQGVFFYLLRSGLESKENLRPSNIPERKVAGTNVPKKVNVNHDTLHESFNDNPHDILPNPINSTTKKHKLVPQMLLKGHFVTTV